MPNTFVSIDGCTSFEATRTAKGRYHLVRQFVLQHASKSYWTHIETIFDIDWRKHTVFIGLFVSRADVNNREGYPRDRSG